MIWAASSSAGTGITVGAATAVGVTVGILWLGFTGSTARNDECGPDIQCKDALQDSYDRGIILAAGGSSDENGGSGPVLPDTKGTPDEGPEWNAGDGQKTSGNDAYDKRRAELEAKYKGKSFSAMYCLDHGDLGHLIAFSDGDHSLGLPERQSDGSLSADAQAFRELRPTLGLPDCPFLNWVCRGGRFPSR